MMMTMMMVKWIIHALQQIFPQMKHMVRIANVQLLLTMMWKRALLKLVNGKTFKVCSFRSKFSYFRAYIYSSFIKIIEPVNLIIHFSLYLYYLFFILNDIFNTLGIELKLEASAEHSGSVLHMDSSTAQAFNADHVGKSDTSHSE